MAVYVSPLHANHPMKEIEDPTFKLALPFDIQDIDLYQRMISPFGLIRHSKDSGIGHGGIDIPLQKKFTTVRCGRWIYRRGSSRIGGQAGAGYETAYHRGSTGR